MTLSIKEFDRAYFKHISILDFFNFLEILLKLSKYFLYFENWFGISFLEAPSYKVASIGGNCGGERDSILDGKTGYICDGNDLNSIYGSVLKFFENDNCNVLGSSAFEFSRNFSWNKIIKKYLDLI